MKMKRMAYEELLAWKASKSRKPLILYGARQVGKTWLLKEFGKSEYKTVIYINFDKDAEAHKYFTGNVSPDYIITGLEDYSRKKIVPEET
ncbi:MAG: AAA family ATPase, partial [Treponema sp.]|nr:AAA family ATPase [Treponema sp.]